MIPEIYPKNTCTVEYWYSATQIKYYAELMPYAKKDKIIESRSVEWSHYGTSIINKSYDSFVHLFESAVRNMLPEAKQMPTEGSCLFALSRKSFGTDPATLGELTSLLIELER